MGKRSIDYMTEANSFIYQMSGYRVLGTVNGRTIRRAAERKRRIEAKKLAKLQSSNQLFK